MGTSVFDDHLLPSVFLVCTKSQNVLVVSVRCQRLRWRTFQLPALPSGIEPENHTRGQVMVQTDFLKAVCIQYGLLGMWRCGRRVTVKMDVRDAPETLPHTSTYETKLRNYTCACYVWQAFSNNPICPVPVHNRIRCPSLQVGPFYSYACSLLTFRNRASYI